LAERLGCGARNAFDLMGARIERVQGPGRHQHTIHAHNPLEPGEPSGVISMGMREQHRIQPPQTRPCCSLPHGGPIGASVDQDSTCTVSDENGVALPDVEHRYLS